jgi:hypothetical protein
VNPANKPTAGVLPGENGRVSAPPSGLRRSETAGSAKNKTVAATPSARPSSKTTQATPLPSQSSRAASKPDKLVCRYCGSDDLAPSFKKRRDARCRACFKQRYGSAARDKKTMRRSKTKARR